MDEHDVKVGGSGALQPQKPLARLINFFGELFGGAEQTQTKKKIVHEGKWEVVAETFGLMDAQVMVGRLHAEGIPARAWQEGAGRALGLTVGKLGTAYIEVPEAFFEQAEEILEIDYSEEFSEEDEEL